MIKKIKIISSIFIFVSIAILLIFAAYGNNKSSLNAIYGVSTSNQNVKGEGSYSNNSTADFTTSKNTSIYFSKPKSVSGAKDTSTSVTEMKSNPTANSHTQDKQTPSNRKVILTGDMTIETNKFDSALSVIIKKTETAGGFVENSNVNGIKSEQGNYLENREANLTLRIPSSKFETFMMGLGNLGVITSKTTSGEDVTSQYFDSEARLKSQKVKEERLLDILKKTKNLPDVLAVETELETTRYEIESLTGTLKKWDNQIAYSTLTISLKEVYEKKLLVKKPVTLGDRIGNSFSSSITNLVNTLKSSLVLLAGLIPYLVIIIILLIFVWIYFKRRKKNTPQ